MVKFKKFKKVKIKICDLKPTLAENILSKKAKRRSFLSKFSFNKSKTSLKKNKKRFFPSKINFQTDSLKRIRRWYLKNKKSLSSKFNQEARRIRNRKRWRRLSFSKRLHKKFRKIFGCKRYAKTKLKLPVEGAHSLFYFKLTILIKKNNVFCNFSDFKDNKTLNSCSSGKYKIKVSKKTLKYTHDLVLDRFYREIWRKVYSKIKKKEFKKNQKNKKNNKDNKKNKKVVRRGLFVNIVCSTRLRKKVCRYVFRKFKKIPLIINAVSKKVFNGCRPPKKVRKKRRRMRIYK